MTSVICNLSFISFYLHVVLDLKHKIFVCTVNKISPLKTKFFMYVIVVMKFLFHLFHVVTVVYNGGSCI